MGKTPSPDAEGVMRRLADALQRAGLSQAEAARKAQQIDSRAARAVLNKSVIMGTRPRSQEVREAFARALGVNGSWLWYGHGQLPSRQGPFMVRDLVVDPDHDLLADDPSPEKAGRATGAMPFALRPDPQAYPLPVPHDSWAPFAYRGDCLYITPSYPPVTGDRVYVRSPQGCGVFRLVTLDAASITLTSPAGLQITLPTEQTTVHKVSGAAFA